MREFGLTIGVERHEGRVVTVERDPASGDVTALILADGRRIEGDLFIDCSGFRSILLGQELGVAVQWRHPEIGDTQAMFETLVALDTDRAGLKARARRMGVTLTGWLAGLVARDWSGDEFSAALMERKRIVNLTWRFFEGIDFLLTPTTAAPAFGIDLPGPTHIDGRPVAPTAWIAFSALANLTGLPAASVPIGFTADGRPIGLQILGRHLDDRGVLGLASMLELLCPRTSWPGPAF